MKKIFCITLISILFLSCSDKCLEGKHPVPATFFVEIIDETTNENVFENETFAESDIKITDVIGNEVPYNFIEGINTIQLYPKTTINANNIDVKITLNNQTTMLIKEVNLKYNVESKQEECYTSFSFTNILFPDNDSELVGGVFKVKI
ncbi:hypothetical protein LXD69_12120 [Flavobacterium sediminilitoris]|uniref:Lipoprotein n=1 Tax=Flavobacterium sediminilitoris TaxID=2024526 RepID=A0ABY4HKQ3_9FLAO|nr:MULTISPECIES: hypothetical protein [Flavobacterium]UOX32782.1 hypothetical protein LXD69_12120 [Flavobacterium sediminilitoris]